MPLDRGIIDQQLRELGESPRWWEQRELRDLPAVLGAEERVLAISRGKIARPRLLRRSWLIVITNRRLICLRSASGSAWTQMEVGGSLVSRVTLRIGPFRGRVLVVAAGQTYRLYAPRADAYKLFDALTTFVPVAKESVGGSRPGLMVRRVIDHVLALPAAALGPEPRKAPPATEPADQTAERHVELLEEQLHELQKQVDFLEDLLHRQHKDSEPARRLHS